MNLLTILRCPACYAAGLRLDAGQSSADGMLRETGVLVCDACEMRYPIADGIVDLALRNAESVLTTAGRSNLLPMSPQVYEHAWRPRSLSILSGGEFSTEQERALLLDWARPKPHAVVLDLGCATGLYARSLAGTEAGPGIDAPLVIALDLSRPMLREARRLALRAGLRQIVFIRAAAQNLPFVDGSIDQIVCGGSLNEFASPPLALRESFRAAKPDACLFAMVLAKASTGPGRAGQRVARASGIQFPDAAEWAELLQHAGWRTARTERHGAVMFNLSLKPNELARVLVLKGSTPAFVQPMEVAAI